LLGEAIYFPTSQVCYAWLVATHHSAAQLARKPTPQKISGPFSS
jgi:hypothetical protein